MSGFLLLQTGVRGAIISPQGSYQDKAVSPPLGGTEPSVYHRNLKRNIMKGGLLVLMNALAAVAAIITIFSAGVSVGIYISKKNNRQ